MRNMHGHDEETTGKEETSQNPPMYSNSNAALWGGNDSACALQNYHFFQNRRSEKK
jgi:hypothetical protein